MTDLIEAAVCYSGPSGTIFHSGPSRKQRRFKGKSTPGVDDDGVVVPSKTYPYKDNYSLEDLMHYHTSGDFEVLGSPGLIEKLDELLDEKASKKLKEMTEARDSLLKKERADEKQAEEAEKTADLKLLAKLKAKYETKVESKKTVPKKKSTKKTGGK